MSLIWTVALLLGSGFAIVGAQKVEWKLVNLAIILGCMGLGFGIGHAAGFATRNVGRFPHAAVPFAMVLGIAGAFGCVYLNSQRGK